MSYADLARIVTLRPLAGDLPFDATRRRRRAPFRAGWSRTVDLLLSELRALSAKRVVLEIAMSEMDFRNDGLPRAHARAAHPGIVLSFDSKHGPLRYVVDSFDDWQDNVRALALSLNALRTVDRYGVTRRGEQYAGWKALPAGPAAEGDPHRGRKLSINLGGVTAALRATHPDTREAGFDDRDFQDVMAFRSAERMDDGVFA